MKQKILTALYQETEFTTKSLPPKKPQMTSLVNSIKHLRKKQYYPYTNFFKKNDNNK